jgi:hypothetical protein
MTTGNGAQQVPTKLDLGIPWHLPIQHTYRYSYLIKQRPVLLGTCSPGILVAEGQLPRSELRQAVNHLVARYVPL